MMWIGSLALAVFHFFAGYYSKDLILESARLLHSWFRAIRFIGWVAAAATAFYSWRLIIMTFHGKPRADHHVMDHVHESPAVMTVPFGRSGDWGNKFPVLFFMVVFPVRLMS